MVKGPARWDKPESIPGNRFASENVFTGGRVRLVYTFRYPLRSCPVERILPSGVSVMSYTRNLTVLLLAVTLAALPGVQAWGHPSKLIVLQPGQAFCPSHALMVGTVIIQEGRCFMPFLLRTVQGAFLGFGPAGSVFIPPGHVIRLDTPLGAQIRTHIFLLLPIRSAVTLIPVNTIQLVVVRIEDLGPRLLIVLPGGPAPVLVVPFTQRQSAIPVPDDVRIFPPGAEVPREEAAFSGKWTGEWKGKWRGLVDGALPHTLVVEEIRRESPISTTTAIVVFAWGATLQWGISPGWYRLRGMFEGGVLRLTLPSGARVTYRINADATLDGTYERADFGALRAAMKRSEE